MLGPAGLRNSDDVPLLPAVRRLPGAAAGARRGDSGTNSPMFRSAEPSPMAKRRVSTGDECVGHFAVF